MDTALFSLIFSFSHRWPLLDGVGIFFAEYAIGIFAVLVFFIIVSKKNPSRALYGNTAILLLCSILLALGINALIGSIAFRERPFFTLDIQPLIFLAPTNKSFPSDHTAVAFALATIGAFVRPRAAVVFFVFAFLIGIGRVFVGVHYPFDILGGSSVGIISALFVIRLYGKYPRSIL